MTFRNKIMGFASFALAGIALQSVSAVAETQLTFAVTGGFQAQPEYFGAEDYVTGPLLGLSPKYLQLDSGKSFGNPDPWADKLGFNVSPSLRVISERDAETYSEFSGLEDIDTAIELGAQVSYATQNVKVFGAMRKGFGGHEGYVGELGLDLIAKPTDKWRIAAGPRVNFGDDTFADTYFGVAPGSVNYGAYDADGGVLSTGVSLEARYQFNDNWGVTGQVEWSRFQNDAADSPIVEAGSDSDTRVSVGLTRVLRLNF